MERQEKKVITDIKKMAKTGQMVCGDKDCLLNRSLRGRKIDRVRRWCVCVCVTVCAGGGAYHGEGPGTNQKLHQEVLPHEGQYPGHLPQTAGIILLTARVF